METVFYSLHSIPPFRKSSLSLRFRRSSGKTLKMSLPAQIPEIQSKKVIVENKYGEKLVGLLHETGSPEIVILCHGFQATKEDPIMVNLAAALESKEIACFRFDFAGNGESEGSFEFGNYAREADDLYAVVQYFSGAGRVIRAVLGHSKGGDVVLLYASKYHNVPMVINVSGRYDLKKGIKERVGEDFMQRLEDDGFVDVKNKSGRIIFRVTAESMRERLNTDMHRACLQIDKECRVHTVHGSADEVIPVEDAYQFDKIIPNHKLHIVEGANHSYTSHQAELASVVLDIFKTVV